MQLPLIPIGMKTPSRIHPAVVSRTLLGLALLIRPELIAEVVVDEPVDRCWITLARVLGARHLVEVIAVNIEPEPRFARVGATVDAIHACTAAGFAMCDSQRRRMLLVNALAATAFAVTGAHHARVLLRAR